jgi:hypothetical protein
MFSQLLLLPMVLFFSIATACHEIRVAAAAAIAVC